MREPPSGEKDKRGFPSRGFATHVRRFAALPCGDKFKKKTLGPIKIPLMVFCFQRKFSLNGILSPAKVD